MLRTKFLRKLSSEPMDEEALNAIGDLGYDLVSVRVLPPSVVIRQSLGGPTQPSGEMMARMPSIPESPAHEYIFALLWADDDERVEQPN